MTQQERHFETTESIDVHINEPLLSASRTNDGKYQTWYALTLSAIALVAAGEKAVYAYSNYHPGHPDGQLVVFTQSLVILTDADPSFDGAPLVRAIPRSSLTAVAVSASERIDARDRRSHEWPGNVSVRLNYRDLEKQIEIVGEGFNRYAVDKPSPLGAFIESLKADLT